jgi:hypothetical protein
VEAALANLTAVITAARQQGTVDQEAEDLLHQAGDLANALQENPKEGKADGKDEGGGKGEDAAAKKVAELERKVDELIGKGKIRPPATTQIRQADTQFLTFRCGGDSRLVVTKSTTGTHEEATKASWRVEDLASEVAELRARASSSRTCPSWEPSTASPTSASPWRPGSSTRTTTGSACSNSKIPACDRTAPQPAPDGP